MPGTDLLIDPLTRDFVDDGAGDWVETSTLQPQILHQLLDHRGLWFADVEAGCSAYTIPKKANRRTFVRIEDAYREALRPFTDTGLAEDLEILIDTDQRGRLAWQGSLVDVQHGELDITPLLSFGTEP